MLVKHLFVANISIARLQGCTAEPVYITIDGLIDMVNLYLNGGLVLTLGQSISYSTALNSALTNVNNYWHGSSLSPGANCGDDAGVLSL